MRRQSTALATIRTRSARRSLHAAAKWMLAMCSWARRASGLSDRAARSSSSMVRAAWYATSRGTNGLGEGSPPLCEPLESVQLLRITGPLSMPMAKSLHFPRIHTGLTSHVSQRGRRPGNGGLDNARPPSPHAKASRMTRPDCRLRSHLREPRSSR